MSCAGPLFHRARSGSRNGLGIGSTGGRSLARHQRHQIADIGDILHLAGADADIELFLEREVDLDLPERIPSDQVFCGERRVHVDIVAVEHLGEHLAEESVDFGFGHSAATWTGERDASTMAAAAPQAARHMTSRSAGVVVSIGPTYALMRPSSSRTAVPIAELPASIDRTCTSQPGPRSRNAARSSRTFAGSG